jgi:poly(3-hydroxybutyrate) depolymerase
MQHNKKNNMDNFGGYFDGTHLYSGMELQKAMLSPVNFAAKVCREMHSSSLNPMAYTAFGRNMAAACELVERATKAYLKPEFGIDETEVDGQKYAVKQLYTRRKPWCNLIHFKKDGLEKKLPRMLIVAPMSGHFATLCRGTVKDLLPHYDVYITDWVNARDVPMNKGNFDLDDYIDYLISFMQLLGKDLHLIAVCQPAVPTMAAVSIMASNNDPACPASMTLIGGPIDTRQSPTEVNKLAERRSLKWFERNVITRVPINYPGFMRRVYPGFLQLTGFMTMNLDRHISAHMDLYNHLVEGDGESADSHKDFYNEYLAVMDITSEFYLQTIHTVFQDHSLPKGTWVSKGREIRPQDIKRTAILALEGEKDDISGHNQTKAALEIATGLSADKKWYRLQPDVGHYGLFNGRRFREKIVPYIKEFTNSAQD